MKKILFATFLLFFFLQLSVLNFLFPDWPVNWLFLFVMAISLVFPFRENFFMVLAAGIVSDLFSSAGFGIYSISFLLLAVGVDEVRKVFLAERRGTLMPLVIFFASQLAFDILVHLSTWLFAYLRLSPTYPVAQRSWLWYMIGTIGASFFAWMVYRTIDHLERSIGRSRMDLKVVNR